MVRKVKDGFPTFDSSHMIFNPTQLLSHPISSIVGVQLK